MTRFVCVFLAFVVAAAYGLLAYQHTTGAIYMNGRRAVERTNPLLGLSFMLASWQRWPYSTITRQQLFLNVMRVRDKTRLRFDPASVDKIYRISTSASPYFPGLRMSRANYLIGTGRNPAEVEEHLKFLKRTSALMADTWIVEMNRALQIKDKARAEIAMRRLRSTAKRRAHFAAIKTFGAILNSQR